LVLSQVGFFIGRNLKDFSTLWVNHFKRCGKENWFKKAVPGLTGNLKPTLFPRKAKVVLEHLFRGFGKKPRNAPGTKLLLGKVNTRQGG